MTVVEPTRDRGWRTVPNLISLIRLLCVPVFVYLLLGADRPLAAGAGPTVLLSASAIGIYGDRGDEVLTEASAAPADPDFLARVCVAWEAATAPAEAAEEPGR